jgi:hypothetical protein
VAERSTHHDCYGCGRSVPNRLFACGPCWHRLPLDLQRPITGNKVGTLEHLRACADARRWYREQERTAMPAEPPREDRELHARAVQQFQEAAEPTQAALARRTEEIRDGR